ncbi:hypothetical protein SAMN02745857_02415 [Andreprevotia lacus DSM 23236]|jgi:hypothetical protein|uniref:Uncharacterized protein n=1 Tax=Andreprevotia lacus DSM 23236 TaxID=1121001 RepID=A0A1W1XRQ6_9NEIS|nr:hypothetical protein [Andreprevotia lacus]SMC26188.1 hypothetical protein SAMN02745857_02415 [Andreprevotia lacus DSM 23236]
MPINHFDLQRLAAVRIKENIRKKGSPDRFGKDSSDLKGDEGATSKSLVGRLIKQHVDTKK